VHIDAEFDALVERLRRLLRRVHVLRGAREHVTGVVVDCSLDHAVVHGLGDDELCVGGAVQSQLCRDISERNATVRRRDLAQARLDDILTQTTHQSQQSIL
jgi:hypothetical protein